MTRAIFVIVGVVIGVGALMMIMLMSNWLAHRVVNESHGNLQFRARSRSKVIAYIALGAVAGAAIGAILPIH